MQGCHTPSSNKRKHGWNFLCTTSIKFPVGNSIQFFFLEKVIVWKRIKTIVKAHIVFMVIQRRHLTNKEEIKRKNNVEDTFLRHNTRHAYIYFLDMRQ